MKGKRDIFRPDAVEDFAKTMPTPDPNPENLTFLQGYEGEMLRELVTTATDSTRDSQSPTYATKGLDNK